jgi:hypothetical protein
MDSILLASERHDWQSPDNLLDLVRKLGPIVLDPCTDATNPCQAKRFYTEGGLEQSWYEQGGATGITYVNPPYGRLIQYWVQKCIAESVRDVEIVLLTPCRPDTDWYDRARATCKAWCEVKGRLRFKGAPAPAPFPSAVHYWGPTPHLFAHYFTEIGRVGVRS